MNTAPIFTLPAQALTHETARAYTLSLLTRHKESISIISSEFSFVDDVAGEEILCEVEFVIHGDEWKDRRMSCVVWMNEEGQIYGEW